MSLYRYANRKLLLVFMQPGCGPCHGIVPALNRLNDVGEVQVLVIHNGATQAVREWIKKNQPHFSVAVQDHFGLSKRYEAFATPFAFLIDERGVISALSGGLAQDVLMALNHVNCPLQSDEPAGRTIIMTRGRKSSDTLPVTVVLVQFVNPNAKMAGRKFGHSLHVAERSWFRSSRDAPNAGIFRDGDPDSGASHCR